MEIETGLRRWQIENFVSVHIEHPISIRYFNFEMHFFSLNTILRWTINFSMTVDE